MARYKFSEDGIESVDNTEDGIFNITPGNSYWNKYQVWLAKGNKTDLARSLTLIKEEEKTAKIAEQAQLIKELDWDEKRKAVSLTSEITASKRIEKLAAIAKLQEDIDKVTAEPNRG